MNAQEAAKKVNSGMNNLSLAELMEVHAVLKTDENNAGLFKLVNGFAKGQLSSYARSSADFQAHMSLEDAKALRELAEEVGFDKDDNMTEDGKKALEIAARISKHNRDKEVAKIVEAKQKEQGSKKSAKAESIPLTPEQIRYLDEHGILHNGTLESISWFKDKDDALKILSEANVAPKDAPKAPIAEVKDEPKDTPIAVNETDNLKGVDIAKNMQQLEMLSSSINPLDEKDKTFADSRASLNVLDVYDEQGNKHDVRAELVEQAKIKTEAEMMDSKKVTKEEYVERLKFNIDTAVYSIVTGNEIDFSKYTGNKEHLRQVLQNKIDTYVNADAKKPSKAHVRLESVLGFMATESARIDAKIEKIERAFGSLPVIQKFKAKIRSFDERCEKKFGPKTWGFVRGAALMAEKAAPDIGMAFVAGFGGPLGMAAYGAYVFKKHVIPFTNKYMEQPKEERTSFRKFVKQNKKEAAWAGLFTASSLLSLGAAGLGALTHVGDAQVVAQATMLTQHTSTAKMSISGAAMLTRSATSVYEAQKAGDTKERNRRLLIGLGSAAAFAGGIWARDLLGKWLGEGKEDTNTNPSEKKPINNEGIVKGTDSSEDTLKVVSDTTKTDTIVKTDGPLVEQQENPQGTGPDVIVQYDDFYHGPEVEAKSHESVIRLLTNSRVSRSEATLKAEMMIYRVGHMDEQIRQAFPNASNAQIAHAILLRAADVRKGDADELLRALLGDENCRKLTMEQQISEIHKGLTGYNYGQRSDLKFGYSLDPNYVPMNTRSLFLLDDCESERLIDRVGGGEKPIESTPVENRGGTEPNNQPTPPEPDDPTPASKEVEERGKPVEEEKVEPTEPKQPTSPKVGKTYNGKDTLAGGRDQINRLAVEGVVQHSDGKFRYVDYGDHYKILRKLGYEDTRAQEIVNNRIVLEQHELKNMNVRDR